MFVELYRNELDYCNGLAANPRAVDIIPTNTVVNVDAIVSIWMVPTEINGKKFHRVRITPTAEVVETQVGKLYTSDRDFERLIH